MAFFGKSNNKLFGAEIQPRCEYCHFGKISKDGSQVHCEKKGVVALDFQCKAFTYSPLKRVPKKQFAIPGNFEGDEA